MVWCWTQVVLNHCSCTIFFFPEVTNEELDYLVQRMNKHIEGLSSDDKESAVIDLIFSTGSRIMPGLRYLPLHWYPPGEYVGPDVILDEDNRRVDGKGKPIVDTDDEVVAIVQGEGGGKHDSNDVPMPSSTAILSDPSTDSERGPGSYRKKRKVPRFEFPTDQVSVIHFFTFSMDKAFNRSSFLSGRRHRRGGQEA